VCTENLILFDYVTESPNVSFPKIRPASGARSGLGVNDTARAEKALKGIVGKRLTYRRPDEGPLA
jgi:hypothetical protein